MISKNKVSEAILYVCLLAFVSFVVYILNVNKEVLYMAHSRSEFLFGEPFFNGLMSKPFGLMQYVGAWLTQFLFNPSLGAGMFVGIWMLIFVVGIKAFRLGGGAKALMLLPVACLLASIVDLGYWIYTFSIRGYWFSQSVAYLAMLLLLWAARCTPRKWHIAFYLLGFCLYPILGWFAMLFILCLALSEKISWREGLAFLILLATIPLWRALLYSNLKVNDVVLAGLPIFENPADVTKHLSNPFWFLGMVSIFIPLFASSLKRWFVPVLCTVGAIYFINSSMFKDTNYISEMRMTRAADDDNWKEVLKIYNASPNPTLAMVTLKNIALMNEGTLLDRSFAMGNNGAAIYNPDTLHVSFLEIAAPVSYYNYGLINEGFRLAFECAEQSGFSPLYLKMMSRCALANGETKLVERYTEMLHHHPFYADWQPAPVSANVKELKKAYPDELSGVEHSYSYIINSISVWNEANSKIASEQALFYSMLRCDSKRFWPALRQYVKWHKGEEFPRHAQEAYILFYDKAPEEKKMMIPVSQEVYDRYKKFGETIETLARSGVDIKDIPARTRGEFGDTYWYFNIFGKKIY